MHRVRLLRARCPSKGLTLSPRSASPAGARNRAAQRRPDADTRCITLYHYPAWTPAPPTAVRDRMPGRHRDRPLMKTLRGQRLRRLQAHRRLPRRSSAAPCRRRPPGPAPRRSRRPGDRPREDGEHRPGPPLSRRTGCRHGGLDAAAGLLRRRGRPAVDTTASTPMRRPSFLPAARRRRWGPPPTTRRRRPCRKRRWRCWRKRGSASSCREGSPIYCGQPFESRQPRRRRRQEGEGGGAGMAVPAATAACPSSPTPVRAPTGCSTTLPDRLPLHDSIEFIRDRVLPAMTLAPIALPVTVPPGVPRVQDGPRREAAGDRGACAAPRSYKSPMACAAASPATRASPPELNRPALRPLNLRCPPVRTRLLDESHLRNGLSEHAGFPYRSILRLVDACATARDDAATASLAQGLFLHDPRRARGCRRRARGSATPVRDNACSAGDRHPSGSHRASHLPARRGRTDCRIPTYCCTAHPAGTVTLCPPLPGPLREGCRSPLHRPPPHRFACPISSSASSRSCCAS